MSERNRRITQPVEHLSPRQQKRARRAAKIENGNDATPRREQLPSRSWKKLAGAGVLLGSMLAAGGYGVYRATESTGPRGPHLQMVEHPDIPVPNVVKEYYPQIVQTHTPLQETGTVKTRSNIIHVYNYSTLVRFNLDGLKGWNEFATDMTDINYGINFNVEGQPIFGHAAKRPNTPIDTSIIVVDSDVPQPDSPQTRAAGIDMGYSNSAVTSTPPGEPIVTLVRVYPQDENGHVLSPDELKDHENKAVATEGFHEVVQGLSASPFHSVVPLRPGMPKLNSSDLTQEVMANSFADAFVGANEGVDYNTFANAELSDYGYLPDGQQLPYIAPVATAYKQESEIPLIIEPVKK